MNLKERYEKLFGKMEQLNHLGQKVKDPTTKQPVSESDMQRWEALNKYFRNQYPTHTLQMKEGLIMVNKVVVENAESFFAKNNNQISSLLKGVCSKLNG